VSSRFPLDPVALAADLVAIDSRNPDLVAGAPGEARVGPTGRTPLLLNGHLDVVGVEGMTHAPFDPVQSEGRLYGRGANDMKGGVAAMCVAAARAAARGALASEIIIAAVCDEEYRSIGTRALLANGLRATAAIVTEPTRLAVCPAHKGFAWFDVSLPGHAAHGSRPDVGVDAIAHAGLLLSALLAHEDTVLRARTHPLLGHPSVHASTITGGTGWSTYPAHCHLQIERRTVPGETGEQALAELEALCEVIAHARPAFRAELSMHTVQPPNDVDPDSAVVMALRAALHALGQPPSVDGLSCWTDAALFTAAGVPAVCFGPGDIARAHAAEEWIGLDELQCATDVLERVCSEWGRADAAPSVTD
jgi:acetylornithine deacetylase